jgi:hypothetical protein
VGPVGFELSTKQYPAHIQFGSNLSLFESWGFTVYLIYRNNNFSHQSVQSCEMPICASFLPKLPKSPIADGDDLSEADVTAVETCTEGWIASLQLAALSMQL